MQSSGWRATASDENDDDQPQRRRTIKDAREGMISSTRRIARAGSATEQIQPQEESGGLPNNTGSMTDFHVICP